MIEEALYNKLSNDLKLDNNVIKKVYKSYWRAIREHITSLPLKRELSEKEFNSIKTSINIPSLGKLSCTYKRYVGVKERLNYIKGEYKNDTSKKN